MDFEMMVAIRKARINNRTAWKVTNARTLNRSIMVPSSAPGRGSAPVVPTRRKVTA